jgi:uncharacterized protein YfkK (UPF0435 family)
MNAEVVISASQEVGSSGITNVLTVKHGSFGNNLRGTFHVKYEHIGVESLRPPEVMDGYVFGILFFAMQGAKRIVVEGQISDLAIRNAWSLGEAWHNLLPDMYKPVIIEAQEVVSEWGSVRDGLQSYCNGAIAAFSGGVDSMFTALRHTDGSLASASIPLTDLLMVHGFDVALDNQSAFDELTNRTEGFVKEVALRRHFVKTNLKAVSNQNWEHSFAAQLSSVLHQFSGRMKYGVIGSSEPYDSPVPIWGSTPATDYLLSGKGFSVVHDGAGYSRTEKVKFLANSKIARQSVKVCWQGINQGRNCGHCEKCIRTKLNFLAAGVVLPECFEEELTELNISSLTVSNNAQFNELKSILDYVDKNQFSDRRFEILGEHLKSLTHIHEQRDELTKQRDELTKQRDEIVNSTIWKLTTPLRKLIDLFKK